MENGEVVSNQFRCTPDPGRSWSAGDRRFMAPTKKKNTGKDSDGDREIGALDREGVPAELRPPLPQANWDLALALSRLGSDLLQKWPELSSNLHRSIETPFADHNLPRDTDGIGAYLLLSQLGDALRGMGSWEDLRTAFAALRGAERGLGERQFIALDRCTWALKAWKKVPRKRRPREPEAAHALRLKELRPTESRIVTILCACLSEQERAFARLKHEAVRKRIEKLLSERQNASPIRLLLDLSTLAGVWPDANEGSIRDAKKRHPGS